MPEIINQRIVAPLKKLLTEGLSPAKLALALSAGLVLGVTPMLGISSVLAVAVAYGLKLNQVGIQLGNYAAYPLQIILFIPFIRAGEWLLGLPSAAINPTDIAMMFGADPAGSLTTYGTSLGAAFLVWLLLAIPTAWLLRYPLRWLLMRYGPQEVSA
ncbi:MAG: DUF2062 domain-containing protein [Cellvibrionales bacterium]|jgi:hypothetical protein